jgi:hypothetical protein
VGRLPLRVLDVTPHRHRHPGSRRAAKARVHGLGWVAGVVLRSVVRRTMPIIAPYYCQRPVSYDVVAAIRWGDPLAAPRTWESHPNAYHLRQRAGSFRRRCRIFDDGFYKSVYSPLSPSQSAFVFPCPLTSAFSLAKIAWISNAFISHCTYVAGI